MTIFEVWWNNRHPDDEVPKGEINGSWFVDRALPMIVECCQCEMTMALPSAFVGEDNYIYCSCCAGEE